MIKKYWPFLMILVVLAIVFHFIAKGRLVADYPPFVSSKVDELMNDQSLMDSIGGHGRFEAKYNIFDFRLKDTVDYTINITGRRKVLTYRGVEIKVAPGKWIHLSDSMKIE